MNFRDREVSVFSSSHGFLHPSILPFFTFRILCFVEWWRRTRVDFHRDTMMNAAMSAFGARNSMIRSLSLSPSRASYMVVYTLYVHRIAQKLGFTRFCLPHFSLSLSLWWCFSPGERWIYSRSISCDFLPVNLPVTVPRTPHNTCFLGFLGENLHMFRLPKAQRHRQFQGR